MLESYLRPQYEKVLIDPVVKLLPDHIDTSLLSVWGGIMGVLVLPMLYVGWHFLAILLLLASGYLVTLVSGVVKERSEHCKVSAVLHEIINRVVEIAIIIGLFAIDPLGRGWLALLMIGAILLYATSFLSIKCINYSQTDNNSHYSQPIMGRAELFVLFVLMIIAPDYFWLFALLFIGLTFYTIYVRIQEFKGVAGSSNSDERM